MKVVMLRTLGLKDAGKYGIDKETCQKCREGEEVDLKKDAAEGLIKNRLAVTPDGAPQEQFEARPPEPMRAVPPGAANANKSDDKNKK